jgi:hypothetical protein
MNGFWTPLLCPKAFINEDTLHSSTKFINKSSNHTKTIAVNVDPLTKTTKTTNNNKELHHYCHHILSLGTSLLYAPTQLVYSTCCETHVVRCRTWVTQFNVKEK